MINIKTKEKYYTSKKMRRLHPEKFFCVVCLVLLCIASTGYTQIFFQDDFELPLDFERDRTTPGWDHQSSSGSPNILERSQNNPHLGDWSMELILTSAEGGRNHIDTYRKPDGYDVSHMRVYMYIASDYDQQAIMDHEHIMGWNTTRGSAEFLDVGINKVAENPDRFSITIPWQNNSGSNQDHNDICPESLWMVRNQWYCVEIAHTTYSTNGGSKLWIDGQLAIDHTGHDVTAWKVDSNWLGTCIKDAGIAGKLYFDDFAQSTSYIGPISGTQYTLTVNTSGSGSVDLSPSGGTYNEGTVVTLTANSDLDWTFDSWSGDLSGSANPETITMNGNKTVTAAFIYSPIQRTLTVNTSGQGSVSLNPPGGTYDDGTVVTLTATPDLDWEFSNWSGDLSGTDNPATITMDSHKSVTAVFNPEGVFEISVSSVSASTHDGNVPENTIDNDLGTRWSANGDGQWIKFDLGTSYTVAYLDIAFYNGDQRISYFDIEISENDVSYTPVLTGGESSGSTTDLETFDFTDTDGRYVKIVGHENSVNTWNSITEVDIWGYSGTPPPQYDLTVNVSGSGSVDLNPSGGTYNEGTVVTLTANADPGWQFDTWSGDLSGSANPETITMNANKTITATFVPVPQYDLTVNVSGSGSVDLNPSGGTYNEGTVVTLTANADPGWQFDSWSGNLSGTTNPETITMDANKSITATFVPVPQYDLTVNVSGSGSVDLNPSGGTYDQGTVVTLTANADPGYLFNGWSGDLSGAANPETITMDSNKNVTATFIEDTGGGDIIHEETQTGSALNSATVTSATINGVAGNLYLAAISPKPYSPVNSVSGLGLTWTLVDEQCGGRYQTNTSVYKAQGTPSGNGTVTATLGSSPEAVVIAVSRYSGVASSNPVGNVISANTNGVEGACSGGTDNSSYSVDLTTTVSNTVAYSVVSRRNKTHTPGSGYTERADFQIGSGGSVAGMAIQDKVIASASTIPADGTFIGPVDWSVIAIEIKPGGGGPAQYNLTVNTSGSGSVDLNPSGSTYDDGTVVTLTANPDPGWQFDSWSGDLTGATNPATITMDGNKNVTATFSQIQYNLTVNTSGSGSVNLNPPGGIYNEETVVTLTANGDPGWQFDNWSGDLTGSANPETITMDANKSVTATFVPVPTYDLTVNISGSGNVALDPPGGTYNQGTIVTLTANADPGWQFDTWSGDLTGSANPATITMEANKNATATFVPVPTYDLTVNITGSGSVDLNPPGGTYNEGTVVTLTANADPGWQFDTWTGDLTGSANPATITMDANKTITATFVPIPQYSLTVNISGSGSVDLNPSGSTYNGGTVVTLTANADTGYLFDNWSGDLSGGSNPETITMDANKTVTATFIGDQGGTYDLNPTDDSYVRGGTSADINYDSDIYLRVKEAAGENNDRHTYLRFDLSSISGTVSTATLKLYCQALSNGAPAAAFVYSVSNDNWNETAITWNNAPAWGSLLDSETDISVVRQIYTFDVTSFVSSEISGDKIVTLMLKDDIEVKKAADFDRREDSNPPVLTVVTSGGGPTQYTLTVNTAGSGSVDLNPPGGTYNSGTVVTLTATSDPGWQFDNWSGDLSGTANPATITMDANKSITATFVPVPQYDLTVNTSGSGSVNLNPSGGTYNEGTIVTLTANADPGWQFDSWSGDLSGSSNPATITMNANKTVTAAFVPVPQYDLTVNISGSGSVNLDPSEGTYNEGTIVTLTANPDTGYLFDGWSGDLSGTVNPETITMNSNKTVTAAFIEDAGSGGSVVHEETQTGSSLNLTTVTSASLTGMSGDLYLAAISSRPILSVSSVSGLGLTWTLVDEQCGGRNQTGVSVWKAQGTPGGNGAVTATFPSAAWSAVIAVSRYSGVSSTSPIGNGISGNTNGLDGACTGGTDSNNYSFNLTTTVDSTVVYSSVAIRNKLHTPGSGYTERAEISEGSGGNVAGIAVQDRIVSSPSTIAVEGTLNGTTDWAVVGLELKPDGLAKDLPMTEEAVIVSLPKDLRLYGNYPNPFNPSTTIRYTLPEAGYVKLVVYDMMGRMVYTLAQGVQNAGMYAVTWEPVDTNGRALPSGVYFCRLRMGSYVNTIKMMYMR